MEQKHPFYNTLHTHLFAPLSFVKRGGEKKERQENKYLYIYIYIYIYIKKKKKYHEYETETSILQHTSYPLICPTLFCKAGGREEREAGEQERSLNFHPSLILSSMRVTALAFFFIFLFFFFLFFFFFFFGGRGDELENFENDYV